MASLDLINELDSQQAWSKARRSIVVQRVLCAIQDCSLDLISFEEARQLLHLNQKICRGLQEIELDKIRGSVGRYQDFTSAFLPRRDNLRQRWQRVRSVRPPVGSLSVLRNTLYNQVASEQEILGMKRSTCTPNVSQTPSLSSHVHF